MKLNYSGYLQNNMDTMRKLVTVHNMWNIVIFNNFLYNVWIKIKINKIKLWISIYSHRVLFLFDFLWHARFLLLSTENPLKTNFDLRC